MSESCPVYERIVKSLYLPGQPGTRFSAWNQTDDSSRRASPVM
ncbi:hypothetical protein ASAP_0382 [Asaia bogorensis]|uniref:Uncharacterized protein n=1 Tax=Asaia bogorensis TaxID=91915 RepID=A0A060QI17_9PROT|nr:hypothetical protein ASAP_0382 [Asaia bogorensis]